MSAGPSSCLALWSQEPVTGGALGQPHAASCPCGLVLVQKRCQPSAHFTTSSSARSQPRRAQGPQQGHRTAAPPHSLLFFLGHSLRSRGTAGWSSKLNSVPNFIYRGVPLSCPPLRTPPNSDVHQGGLKDEAARPQATLEGVNCLKDTPVTGT